MCVGIPALLQGTIKLRRSAAARRLTASPRGGSLWKLPDPPCCPSFPTVEAIQNHLFFLSDQEVVRAGGSGRRKCRFCALELPLSATEVSEWPSRPTHYIWDGSVHVCSELTCALSFAIGVRSQGPFDAEVPGVSPPSPASPRRGCLSVKHPARPASSSTSATKDWSLSAPYIRTKRRSCPSAAPLTAHRNTYGTAIVTSVWNGELCATRVSRHNAGCCSAVAP